VEVPLPSEQITPQLRSRKPFGQVRVPTWAGAHSVLEARRLADADTPKSVVLDGMPDAIACMNSVSWPFGASSVRRARGAPRRGGPGKPVPRQPSRTGCRSDHPEVLARLVAMPLAVANRRETESPRGRSGRACPSSERPSRAPSVRRRDHPRGTRTNLSVSVIRSCPEFLSVHNARLATLGVQAHNCDGRPVARRARPAPWRARACLRVDLTVAYGSRGRYVGARRATHPRPSPCRPGRPPTSSRGRRACGARPGSPSPLASRSAAPRRADRRGARRSLPSRSLLRRAHLHEHQGR
jgi:hypothetical protein